MVESTATDRTASRAVAGTRGERSPLIERLEAIITQDIAQRGLAVDPTDNLIMACRGNLTRAARHLSSEGRSVAIVTGFYVGGPSGPTIETDGPCGAIALAWLLAKQGLRVTLVTDPLGAGAIAAGLEAAGVCRSDVALVVFPFEDADASSPGRCSNAFDRSERSGKFVEQFFRRGPGAELTHMVAVERAGPTHCRDESGSWTESDWRHFERLCPPAHQNQVHNFRGQIITAHTAKLHLLFDFIRANNLPIRTIGIGDGGNEIGMGSIPWSVVHANIAGGLGARIACRIATDWTIACGVSNWGAYALGTAVAWLHGQPELLGEWTDDRERAVLAELVAAGAVDGVTGEPKLSVDGLPIEQHLAMWEGIRRVVRHEPLGRP